MSEKKKERPVSPINGQPVPESTKPFVKGDKRASEAGKKGVEARRKRANLAAELQALLDATIASKDGKVVQTKTAISTQLIKNALNGSVHAYEVIRDTIGEKPVTEVAVIQPDMSQLRAAFEEMMPK